MEGFLSRDLAARSSFTDGGLRAWLESLPKATQAELVKLRTIDLAKRSTSGAVGVAILLALVLASTSYLQDYPAQALSVSVGVVAALGLRLWAAYALRTELGDDAVQAWGRVLTTGIYLTAISWSALIFITIRLFPEEWPMWLVLIGGSGIAAGAAGEFAPRLSLARGYLTILGVPTALMTLTLVSDNRVTLAMVVSLFFWFLLVQSRSNAAAYWQSVRDTITISELNTRLQEEADLFKTAIERSATSAALITADARFTFVNDALCEALGYTREELLAADIHDLAPRFTSEVYVVK